MRIIALDIGSSFTKSAVMDTQTGEILEKKRVETAPRIDRGDIRLFEMRAEDLYASVTALIDGHLAHFPDIEGIFFSTQMHGFVLTRGMQAITPYVSWQDARADIETGGVIPIDALEEKLGPENIRLMGTRYKTGIAACSLYAYRMQHPDFDPSGALFHTLGSYLIYRLNGGTRHACHLTSAAGTGFADASRGIWNQEVRRITGCEDLIFPDIVPETEPLGRYRGVSLYADIGDHQATVYGTQNLDFDDVSITIGTACIICAVADGFVRADFEVRPYFDGRYLMTITRQPGGRVMDVVVDMLRDCARTLTGKELSEAEAWRMLLERIKDDTRGLEIVPDFFIGGGQGKVTGISSGNFTADHLFSAGFHSLAGSYAQAIGRLRKWNPRLKGVLLCGGKLSETEVLRARTEGACGLPTFVSRQEDESLYGLLRIARKIG
ncbi:MAG: sedoheptulokinase [Christensenellales bacterium]|jgi:sugar (pentulose or hexulose) kinase